MAFSVQRTLTRVLRSSSTARGFCLPSSSFPLTQEQLECHLYDLRHTVLPLETFFLSPAGDRVTHHIGTGVFLDPDLIATSARAVGRVTTFFEPRAVVKPDRFEHGGIRHGSEIGSTVARTVDGGVILETKPLAVNFAYDLAVLKVVKPEGELCPHCALASSVPPKNDILSSISHRGVAGSAFLLGKVRATGERTIRAKAPWPLDDRSAWLEHDWFGFGGAKPPMFSCRENITGSITKVSGSPLFNLNSQVVGIASWEVTDEASCYSVMFAAPCSWIRTVLEYAKSKGPEDPIVMDSWVNARVGRGRKGSG